MRLRLVLLVLALAIPGIVAAGDAVTESRRYAGSSTSRFTSPAYWVDDCRFAVNVNPVCFDLPAGTTTVDAEVLDDSDLMVMATLDFYNAGGNIIPGAGVGFFCERVADVPVPADAVRAYVFVVTLPAWPPCMPETTVTSTVGTATLTMRSA